MSGSPQISRADLTYDKHTQLKPSDALQAAAKASGHCVVSISVIDKENPDSHLQTLVLCPTVPRAGDIVSLQDGTLCTVLCCSFNIYKKSNDIGNYFHALPHVTGTFGADSE